MVQEPDTHHRKVMQDGQARHERIAQAARKVLGAMYLSESTDEPVKKHKGRKRTAARG